jgi:hypothetical protein
MVVIFSDSQFIGIRLIRLKLRIAEEFFPALMIVTSAFTIWRIGHSLRYPVRIGQQIGLWQGFNGIR